MPRCAQGKIGLPTRRDGLRPALSTAVVLTLGLGLGLGLGGCAAVEDIARGTRPMAEDVEALARSRWVPRDLPPVRVAEPTTDEIVAAAEAAARPADDMTPEERKEAVDVACQAVDYAKAQDGTDEEAMQYLATRLPSTYAHRQAAEELVHNLESARSSPERAWVLGQAALCEWASSPS